MKRSLRPMLRLAKRLGWLLVVAALVFFGVRRVLYSRAYAEAERTAAGLRATYGEGCVAVLGHDEGAATTRCRVGGVEVGHILRKWGYDHYVLTVGALALDPAAQAARVVVDSFAPDGRPLGTSTPIAPFSLRPHAGQAAEHSGAAPPEARFPFIVALRAPRKGE